MSEPMSSWEAAMIDRLNELVRENRRYFAEVTNGSEAAGLIRLIHGEFNTLKFERDRLVRDHATLTAERDGLRRNNEVLRDVLMDAENALAHSYDVLEWPGDTSNQYDVLMKVRKVLGRDQAQEETRV